MPERTPPRPGTPASPLSDTSPVMRKRSLTINGHRTSLALEAPFWDALGEIATERGLSLSALVAEIDATAPHPNLASAIRCAILAHYRGID